MEGPGWEGPIKQRIKTPARTFKIAAWVWVTQCSPPEHCVTPAPTAAKCSFSLQFICCSVGAGVLGKLFNIRFSYKHCLRLPSYSSKFIKMASKTVTRTGLQSVFTVMQWAPAWEKFAMRHNFFFFIISFSPFYCVQLVPPPPPPHHHHHHSSIVSRTDTSTFNFPSLEDWTIFKSFTAWF